VRAAVAVEAVRVGVGRDAGKGDEAVVGAVRFAVEHELGDVGGEGGRAGSEGVFDVGREAALQAGDVDRVKGITQRETRDGEKLGLRGEGKLAAGVVLAVHGSGESQDGVGVLEGFGGRVDVDRRGQQVGFPVCAEEVLAVDGPGEYVGDGDGGADSAVG